VILDLLPLASSVTVGRMRLNDVAMDSVTGRGLYTTTKFNTLYPVSRWSHTSSDDRPSSCHCVDNVAVDLLNFV